MTTEPEKPHREPEPERVSNQAPPPPRSWPGRGQAWVRRLPGPIGLWLAGVALVAACLIGCGGFALEAVVSHGFGDGGYGRGHDGRYGDERGRNRRDDDRDDRRPTPTPSATVTPSPSPSPASPSPTVSPTA